MKPKFSITIIAKNEEHALPRLFASLKEFIQRGGEICLLDTGSTDNTQKIAVAYGATVFSGRFETVIHEELAKKINKKFQEKGDSPIVTGGNKLFNFAEARNYINSKASNDYICTMDADEAYTTFDIDKINATIDEGFEQFEYQFVYAHDANGRPIIQFKQSKFFDRRKARWTGIVHEMVTGVTRIKYLDESIIKLEHWQEPGKEHRSNYLPGLAFDCFENPTKDRQSHYFAREMLYTRRFRSAIKEFKHHLTMGGWPAERAQSMIFIGRCYGNLGDPENQAVWFSKAFYTDSGRRAALIELALFFKQNDNKQAALAYATAALQIPWVDYYANEVTHYEDLPHEIIYWAKGWLGDISGAQEHILKALEYQPYNEKYLEETKFYFEYQYPAIDGWMEFPELLFLYEEAKKHKVIVEVGSWKGRSTHALLSGTKGIVTAVDTWEGSKDVQDMTNAMAKQEDIESVFIHNINEVRGVKLRTIKKTSIEAAKDFTDGSIDFLFIDAGHTKEEVKEDITVWLPKMKRDGIISGHDYQKNTWMGVVEAVDEIFGKPDKVVASIWSVDLSKRSDSMVEFYPTYLSIKQNPEIEFPVGTKFEVKLQHIPRYIYTCWLSDDPIRPDNIQKCINSQKIVEGYGHTIIDLETAKKINSVYLKDAIDAKKWVKATDFIRMHYLEKYGGIFLDADVEVTGTFDALLNEPMFVGKEVNNPDGTIVIGTAVIGAQKGHPLIKKWMREVEARFTGDDDLNYESSMDLLNLLGVDFQDQMKICEPDVFYPYNWKTEETHRTDNTITVHKFTKSWLPKVESNSLLEAFKFNIENNVNFTFVKCGDGETNCMAGVTGTNCDGHPYSHELGVALTKSFVYLKNLPDVTMVLFEDQKNYNVLLHRTDNDPSSFYKIIARSKRKKYLIAPAKLRTMAKTLGAQLFEVPIINAFKYYHEIFGSIPVQSDAIYMFCAGMSAKVLIADMKKINPDATYLDCGSAFDPLVAQTRTYQISQQEFLYLYMDDNFKLPQTTHPERMFVLNQISESDAKILDLGCGTHKTLDRAVGVDIRPVTDKKASMDDLPFDDHSADIIISRHSLEHMQDPVKTINEWMRVLRPGGRMIIVLPDHGAIDTFDFKYSHGEHFHAWTMGTFQDFIKQFTDLNLKSLHVVLENWSFGAVIEYVGKEIVLPSVDILIPSLGRPEGLKKLLRSIDQLHYSGEIKVYELEGDASVPEKIKEGVNKSHGDIICYMANDTEFTPDSLTVAVERTKTYALVAFNAGPLLPDKGNICEHFVVRRDFIPALGGEIFSTRMHHVGVDNLLWAKATKLGQATWCEKAVIIHRHFSRGGQFDAIYEKGWKHMTEDRAILKQELEKIGL